MNQFIKERTSSKRFLLLSDRGFTIVGSMVAFVLLGISGAGLIHYTSNVRKTSQSTVEKLEYKPILKTKIINGMKALLIEKNIDQNGEIATGDSVNTYGICSLVKAPTDSYGIDEIKLNLFNMGGQYKDSWSEKRWKHFFPSSEWEFVSEECTKIDSTFSNNDLSRCLKYRDDTGSASETVYAIAKIIPKAFPQFETIDVSQQSTSLLDSKKVVFYLTTQLLASDNIDTGSATYTSSLSDIVWANEVGDCNVMAGGEKTIVKFSGTGPGTTFNRNVFNTPIFDEELHRRKLEVLNINADIVQAGRIRNFNLFSLSGLNAKVSCIRNKFKCKQDMFTNDSDYDDLQFVFNVMNHKSSAIPVKAINLTLKRGSSEWDGTDNGILDSGTLSLYDSSDRANQMNGNQAIEFDIPRGASSFRTVADIAPVCHSICSTYKPNQESSYVYPVINIHENKDNGMVFEKDYSDDESNRVRCTVCHMKSCHRYGLGTFGPYKKEKSVVNTQNQQEEQGIIYGLADEPLDGQLPECSVNHEYNDIRTLPSEAVNKSATSGPEDTACKGIAMTEVSSISSFKDFSSSEYEAVDCDTKLPVLCFVNGHYYPAMRITDNPYNPSLPLELVTTEFQNAQKACFDMGREIGRYYDLGVFLFNTYYRQDGRGGSNPDQKAISAVTQLPAVGGVSTAGFNLQSPSDLKFDFINNVSRGIFFTPPAYMFSILPKKIKEVIRKFMNEGKTKIWTAMEWDAGGAVVASPPWALVAKDQPFSLYFSKTAGRPPVLLRDTASFDSEKYLALSYNIRWKGLVPQASSEILPFVCQNKSTKEFFITDSKGTATKGVTKCDASNGQFVPPESSMDWAKMMLLLNPNDNEYPYPDPKVPYPDSDRPITHYMLDDSFLYQKEVENPKAWVALKHVSGTNAEQAPLAKNLRLSRSWLNGSIFLKSSRSEAINAVGKGKYMTSNGVPENLNLPSLGSLSHTSSKINITDYHQLCVHDGLPHSVKPLDKSCSIAVNLSTGTGTFEPVGIKYMIGWDTILSSTSSKKIILYNPSVIKQKIIDINEEIDEKIEEEKRRREEEERLKKRRRREAEAAAKQRRLNKK